MSRRNKPNTQSGALPVSKQDSVVKEQVTTDVVEQPAPTVAPVVVPDAVDAPADADAEPTPDATAEQLETLVAPTPVPETPTTPEIPIAPTPVVAQAEPTPAVEPDNIFTFLKKKYGGIATYPTTVLGIIDKLDSYVAAMGLNVPVTEEIGTRHQLTLLRVYTTALDLPAGGHVLALDVIVWYINKHRAGAFSDRLAARFLNTTSFPPERQRTFVSLTNLFTILANPATRKTLNQHVNMDVVVRNIDSLTHRRNLLSYVSK